MLKGLLAILLAVMEIGTAYAGDRLPHGICLSVDPTIGETCLAYVGKNYSDPGAMRRAGDACVNIKSKWSVKTACPSANRLGICKMSAGTGSETWNVYYTGKTKDAAGAANACKMLLMGKWYAK